MLSRRRWQSIDRKLPLLASGLVLVTVAALGFTAYQLFQRALLDAAAARLETSARVVAHAVQRPGPRRDSLAMDIDRTLTAFLTGRATREQAVAALGRTQSRRDTAKFHSALIDPSGRDLLHVHRGTLPEPGWAARAIAHGEIRGNAVVLGPIENADGAPVMSMAFPLRDVSEPPDGAPLGYVAESWAIASGRGARLIRDMIGSGVTMVLGQPGTGVWTDLEHIVPAPPVASFANGIVDIDGSIGASWPLPGTRWFVWLSQSKRAILAPARVLLLTMFPLGLAIALAGAAIMWRIAQRITHPIVQLTEAVEAVAKDTDDAKGSVRVGGKPAQPQAELDEVARLRLAFERMALRIADREALETQLRHAQKMEAVGRLAGGIAHDFNNLLTAIRSYAELMIQDMPAWDARRADAEEIRKAAQRAATLTAQLLAFSRKQMLQPRVLDVAAVLRDMEGMLRRLLIEDIELLVDAPADLWAVRADRGQLEQVIVNLSVNARDAMPRGGVLRIAASNAVLERPLETRHGVVPAGEYVAIVVTDTGTGMDDVTQGRAFEPFFTTKGVGQGTGLGLATVHGIVAQSGGHVTLESRPGAGSTFTVYLPREHSAPQRDSGGVLVKTHGGHETILLVEDEPAVRSLARRVLVRAGFRVVEAATPSEALRLARERNGEIRLVLSDVVMPEMSGPTLVSKVRELCPGARVLYISGYTSDEVIGRGLGDPEMALLQKPFSAQQLVERVRAAIDDVRA